MKFARYLKDTQTPEWKKAYIDYRGLKKHITAIKKAQETGSIARLEDGLEAPQAATSDEGRRSTSSIRSDLKRSPNKYGSTGVTPPLAARERPGGRSSSPPPVEMPSPAMPLPAGQNKSDLEISTASLSNLSVADTTRPRSMRAKSEIVMSSETRSRISVVSSSPGNGDIPGLSSSAANLSSPGRFLVNLRHRQSGRTSQRAETLSSRHVLPLAVILPTLTPLERQFVEKLDKELEKVEDFYRARESEAMIRLSALKEQLKELQDHRKLFHEAKAGDSRWSSLLPRTVADHLAVLPLPSPVRGGKPGIVLNRTRVVASAKATGSKLKENVVGNGKERERSSSPAASLRAGMRSKLEPEEYQNAKKELKKAILEYYRGLELLNNYRVLNLTGFRKALKKFEKTIKVSVQQAYMQEKVETSAFASGETIENMLKEIESLYAARFEKGDLKKARTRLRATQKPKSHHFSTFRSGLYLGVAIPALVDGLYKSFQPETRASVPWDSLLLVYATFMIPVLFSLLVGINIWVWNRARINYGFIFEFDVRTQLDSREYFELPALLLSTLCYAFWLSYNRIGAHTIAPTTWPLVWLAFAIVTLVNPLPILFPRSRLWLVRKVGKLLVSGTLPVEFTDFWLGDQFCSLIFSLSNLYFVVCAYEERWQNVWVKCSTAKHWGVPFALASLPLAVRTAQSVKRYVDSRLYTHLINGGKYSASIVYYALYFNWRHHNEAHDYTFVLFILFGTVYSIYSCSWDLLMDWSLFKHPAQHRFLRKDLGYSHNYLIYYIAIITNIVIRFSWIIYIPAGSFNFTLRTFVAGMLEMFRRWQWNFFRLENEHIGNTDQYRVTREVPLPYSFGDLDNDTDDEVDDDDDEGYSTKSSWRRRPIRMSKITSSDEERRNA